MIARCTTAVSDGGVRRRGGEDAALLAWRTNAAAGISLPLAPTSHRLASDIAAYLAGSPLPPSSSPHRTRWLALATVWVISVYSVFWLSASSVFWLSASFVFWPSASFVFWLGEQQRTARTRRTPKSPTQKREEPKKG